MGEHLDVIEQTGPPSCLHNDSGHKMKLEPIVLKQVILCTSPVESYSSRSN
jgi:hypothetical protein